MVELRRRLSLTASPSISGLEAGFECDGDAPTYAGNP